MADFKKYIPLVAAGGVAAYLLLRKEEEPEIVTPAPAVREPEIVTPAPRGVSAVKEPLYALEEYQRYIPPQQQMRMLAQPLPAAEPQVLSVSANLDTLSRSLERFQQQQAKIRQQQGLTMYDVVGSDQVDGSQVMELIKKGNKAVFTMPLGLPKYPSIRMDWLDEEPPSATGRMHIYIDTWESFHYFANLIYTIFLMTYPKGRTQAELAESAKKVSPLIQWFQYHKFHLKNQGQVQQTVYNILNGTQEDMKGHLCAYDPRTIETYYTKYDGQYPGFGFVYDPTDGFKYCKTHKMKGVSSDVLQAKAEVLATDGLQLMIEYGAVKFANFAFASAINPKLGEMLGEHVGGAATAAVTLAAMGVATAGLLGTAAVTAAAGPVGWIAAGIAVIAAAINMAFAWAGMQKRNRVVREDAAKFINVALKRYFLRGPVSQTFSGYRMKVLLPQGPPGNAPWEDLTEDLWKHYVMVSSYWTDAVPQLPFYYLNLDFDVLCTVTVPLNQLMILRPIKNNNGITVDFEKFIFSFEEAQAGRVHFEPMAR